MNSDSAPASGTSFHPGWWLVPSGALLLWGCPLGPGIFDAGELTAAAITLGASHPPGQPVHALIAHAATWIPLGSLPFRVALLSLATELGAAWLVFSLVRDICRDLDATWRNVAPHAAGLATLLSAPMVAQSTRVEVYGLALWLTLASVRALLAWRSDDRTGLRAGAFLAGLAAAVHPPHALAAVAFGLALWLPRAWHRAHSFRSLGPASAFFAIGFVGAVSYLPLRAVAGAPMWGDASTVTGLVDYLSGRAYLHNLGPPGASVGVALALVMAWIGAMGFGLVALVRRAPTPRTWLLLGGLLCSLVAGLLQALDPENPDAIAYFAPTVAIGIAAGAVGLSLLPSPAALVLLALGAAQPWTWWSGSPPSHDVFAFDSIAFLQEDAPTPRSLVLVESDFAAAAWMESQAMGGRPDCAVLITGLATSSWHWRTLRTHPLFDGAPVRGSGPSARAAYVDGAVRRALGQVSIASEAQSVPFRHLVGPMTLSHVLPRRDPRPVFAERAFDDALADTPARDETATGAVMRDLLRARAVRLAERGRRADALRTIGLGYAFGSVPEAQGEGPVVPIVLDDESLLTGREDLVRVSAALAVGAGRGDWAREALRAQAARGDALGTLQLGFVELALGDAALARAAMVDYERASGEVADNLRSAIDSHTP